MGPCRPTNSLHALRAYSSLPAPMAPLGGHGAPLHCARLIARPSVADRSAPFCWITPEAVDTESHAEREKHRVHRDSFVIRDC